MDILVGARIRSGVWEGPGGSGGDEQTGLFSTRRPVVHISLDLNGLGVENGNLGSRPGLEAVEQSRQSKCGQVSAGECVEWMSVKLESFQDGVWVKRILRLSTGSAQGVHGEYSVCIYRVCTEQRMGLLQYLDF